MRLERTGSHPQCASIPGPSCDIHMWGNLKWRMQHVQRTITCSSGKLVTESTATTWSTTAPWKTQSGRLAALVRSRNWITSNVKDRVVFPLEPFPWSPRKSVPTDSVLQTPPRERTAPDRCTHQRTHNVKFTADRAREWVSKWASAGVTEWVK